MPTPPDPIIPTAIADAPAEGRSGDYLAPPPALKLTLSRSLPILLLCGTLLFNGMALLFVLGDVWAGIRGSLANASLSGGLLILQFFAIFRSHKWPTFALWLALGGVLAGLYILIVP
jgi:hypothetical protein